MIIYPAIDLRSGKCVRLYQGNFAKETIYSDFPIEMATSFMNEGATWLHVVDLDGAKTPSAHQASLITELIKNVPINIQVGGGVRSAGQVEVYLAYDSTRVVVGSLAVDNPELVERWLQKYGGERIVLAFDVMLDEAGNPFVATQAWQRISCIALFDVITRYEHHGLQHVLCTDISRDGVLNGPNHSLYQALMQRFPSLNIQASGGISTLDDIRHLKNSGLSGAIAGRALYEKKFTIGAALSC